MCKSASEADEDFTVAGNIQNMTVNGAMLQMVAPLFCLENTSVDKQRKNNFAGKDTSSCLA